MFTMTTWFFQELRIELSNGIEQSRGAQGVSPSGANVTDTLESR
jgi:hypothetical protein